MKQITGLTAHPKQIFTMTDESVGDITFTIQYRDRVAAWYLDVESSTLTLRGFRLGKAKNALDQYRRVARFGVTVQTTDRVDPCLLTDWETGRATMYLLDEADTEAVHDYILANGENA